MFCCKIKKLKNGKAMGIYIIPAEDIYTIKVKKLLLLPTEVDAKLASIIYRQISSEWAVLVKSRKPDSVFGELSC